MSNPGYPDTTTFPRVRDVPSAVIGRQRISKAVREVNCHCSGGSVTGHNSRCPIPRVLEIIDGKP